jgi:hypothetical protein
LERIVKLTLIDNILNFNEIRRSLVVVYLSSTNKRIDVERSIKVYTPIKLSPLLRRVAKLGEENLP